MNARKNIQVKPIELGLKDYKETWDYQTELFEGILDIKLKNRNLPEAEQELTPNFLIFCQHPHVFTLGKSGDENNLLANPDVLKEKEALFYKINRGGDITYHGPGQLVGYPIMDLENFFTDIHRYMRNLEEVIILTLADFGIKGERFKGLTGVWVDPGTPAARKICAMGVKTSRWVTMHGFALNINTNLDYFSHIVPCGIDDKAVTSIEKELGHKVDFEEVSQKCLNHFKDIFKCEYL